MAGLVEVEVENAEKIAALLREAPKEMKRALRKSAAIVAREVRGWQRTAAKAGTPQQRRMAMGIGSSANSTSASLTVRNTKSAPGALGAFYGSKQFKQFPTWVGNTWQVKRGQGPQPIVNTLVDRSDEIGAIWLQGQADALRNVLGR